MLRRINVVESEETTWYIEKDKSWNLAAAIWYVKKDKCGWKSEETTFWYVEKDKSWNLAAAIWYVCLIWFFTSTQQSFIYLIC